MGSLLRLLVWLGGLASIFGGLAFCAMYGVTRYYFGDDYQAAALMATFVAIPAGIIGLALDVKWEFSASIHKNTWRREQESAREHLRKREITYRQALSKYFNASFKLAQPPSLLFKWMSGTSDEVNKDELKNQLWVVRYALKIIDPSDKPSDIYDLDAWREIAEELTEELAKVKETRGSWLAGIRDWLNPENLARQVVDRWQSRRAGTREDRSRSMGTERQMLPAGQTSDDFVQEIREHRRNSEREKVPLEREARGSSD